MGSSGCGATRTVELVSPSEGSEVGVVERGVAVFAKEGVFRRRLRDGGPGWE